MCDLMMIISHGGLLVIKYPKQQIFLFWSKHTQDVLKSTTSDWYTKHFYIN